MALKDKKNKTIIIEIEEAEYATFISDKVTARRIIEERYASYPELFPIGMSEGWSLNGLDRTSKKTGYRMRRIKVGNQVYRIRPHFLLSYQRGKVEEVWQGLFLLKFGVPYWALAYVYGKNAMWWYRLYLSLGTNSIVGTSIRKQEDLPADLVSDEYHIRQRGKKVYVATTVGGDCFLGAAASYGADQKSLEAAYGDFKAEALDLAPNYTPKSVNTDGWMATQQAWKALFPLITVVECFLHAFLKVRDRATKKLQPFFEQAATKIWDCYRAESKRSLAQQIRRLREWATEQVVSCPMRDNILKLCKKKKRWLSHFNYPSAHRTSNMADRLMRPMNKHAYNSQMFHSKDIDKTTGNFRAFTLLYNFTPSCPAAWTEETEFKSPAERLNRFTYHENWLCNFQIAASMGGFRNQRNPL